MQRVRHRTSATSLHAVSGTYYLEVRSQVTYYLLYSLGFRVIQELFMDDSLGFCCVLQTGLKAFVSCSGVEEHEKRQVHLCSVYQHN